MRITRDGTGAAGRANACTIELPDSCPLMGVVEQLEKLHFFPDAEEKAIWVMTKEETEYCVYTPSNGHTLFFHTCFLPGKQPCGPFHFRYYASSELRAKHLFFLFGGNPIKLWKRGYLKEYQSYQISKETEIRWAEKLHINPGRIDAAVRHIMERQRSFLRQILQRPAMYVGAHRLDYVQLFFSGWRSQKEFFWNLEYDMERWLFLQCSVSICHAASIGVWSLFFRYFGIRGRGISAFQAFLQTGTLTSYLDRNQQDTVSATIFSVYSACRYSHLAANADLSYTAFENDRTVPCDAEFYANTLQLVRQMFPEPYPELKVYVYYEPYFLQVRFFCRTGQQDWIDGAQWRHEDGYEKKLTELHGYLNVFMTQAHAFHMLTLEESGGHSSAEWTPCDRNTYLTDRFATEALEKLDTMEDLFFKWAKDALGQEIISAPTV